MYVQSVYKWSGKEHELDNDLCSHCSFVKVSNKIKKMQKYNEFIASINTTLDQF